MRNIRVFLLLFIFGIFFSACSSTERTFSTSDAANLSMEKNDFKSQGDEAFQFIVFAHAYGDADVTDNVPSSNLITHLHDLESYQPAFFFSLGDTVQKPTVEQFDILEERLLSKFSVPVFNAVGNHDVMDRDLYTQRFGKTFYTFTYGNSKFFVLDTEINQCNIVGEQRQMLENGITEALQDDSIDQIFIMMHKVLFLDAPLPVANPNDRVVFNGNNFHEILDELLLPAAEQKPLYLFAGDVGAFGGNLSPLYIRDEQANISMYAAGIGDTDFDVVFIVSVDGEKALVQPYRLVDGTILDLKQYDLDYWEQYTGEPSTGEGTSKMTTILESLTQCIFGVCSYTKNIFHIRCRTFFIAVGLMVFCFTGVTIYINKLRKQSTKRKHE